MERIEPRLALCGGVTVTGGEPLEQPDALEALVRALKARKDASVLLFTGFAFERAAPFLEALSPLIDVAVCGPFRKELPQTLPLRGSDNQTLHLLTPKGEAEFAGRLGPDPRGAESIDFMFGADGTVWLAGIPRRWDLERLRGMAESRRAEPPI